jgi:hypothetical protein
MRRQANTSITLAISASLPLFLQAPALRTQETGDDHPAKGSAEIHQLAAVVRGEWIVELEGRNGPKDPFKMMQTTSTINDLLGGAFIKEQILLPTPDGQQIEMIGIWGYDRFRAVYRFTWLDEAFALFDVFEGEWREGVLTMDNTRTRTTIIAGDREYYGRMIWGPFETDGFSVESQVSVDGGKTWYTQTRGRYRQAD